MGIAEKIVSLAARAFLIFIAGMIVGNLKLFPEPFVNQAVLGLRDIWDNGEAYFGVKPVAHLQASRFDGRSGVTHAEPSRMDPGYTMTVGLYNEAFTARLYGPDGQQVYQWPIDFFKVAEDELRFKYDAEVHGAWLYPNGDILMNFDPRGLWRISACGDVVWRNTDETHHSIDIDDKGDIWAPLVRVDYHDRRYIDAPRAFDRIGRFDAETGELLETIDLFEKALEQGLHGLTLGIGNDFSDVLHVNDVEILSSDMAAAFPQFNAGDIMVSSRNINQIWVLDGVTKTIKWRMIGPMLRQHDPDFQPDGTITVYDNRSILDAEPTNEEIRKYGGSQILKIDPITREVTTVFADQDEILFYSFIRGKHQVLKNGNILVTETDFGRILEVTPSGDLVWEVINTWQDNTDEVALVMSADRYPLDYGSFLGTKCPE